MRPHIARLFHEAKTAGLTTSLDTNDDPENLWTDDLREVLNFVDVLLPNEREACRIARTGHVEQAAKILSDRVSIVVIKLGACNLQTSPARCSQLAQEGPEHFVTRRIAIAFCGNTGRKRADGSTNGHSPLRFGTGLL